MTAYSHQEVVGLDVPVNKAFNMHVLDSPDHLISQHQHCLHRESSAAEVEEIFQRWSKQVHNQTMVISLYSIITNMRYTDSTMEDLVDFAFIKQLRMTGLEKSDC